MSISVWRSEEHTSELQSHSFISYAVFCLKKTYRRSRNVPDSAPTSATDRTYFEPQRGVASVRSTRLRSGSTCESPRDLLWKFFFLIKRRPPKSTLFPYTTPS